MDPGSDDAGSAVAVKAGLGGFAAGSLLLVVAYALTRPGSPKAVQAGGGAVLEGLRKYLSSQVPGIPVIGAVRGSVGKAMGDAGVFKLGGRT